MTGPETDRGPKIRPKIRLGTRGSPLALAQAQETRARLVAAHPGLAQPGAVEIRVIKTTGDRIQDRRLSEIGGKGLFTKEIEDALLAREIDAAVHSMKDVPTWFPDGLGLAVILPREDPRDAFFSASGKGLADLPQGALVGTASLRRQAQVLNRRPDLRVESLRGNVQTRLRKLAGGEVEATLLALSGLKRLGLDDKATCVLAPEEMLPAAGQGAIGLETRVDDAATQDLLAPLQDSDSWDCVSAERACLAVLDGSCRTPFAAHAKVAGDTLAFEALIMLPDGTQAQRVTRSGARSDAERLGAEAGQALRDLAGPAFFARLAQDW